MPTPPKPARWSDFDHFVRGEHLAGKPASVTIARLATEETHPQPGKTVVSPVLYFKESKKGLILSPTNIRKLAALFGDNIDAAVGKKVVLVATPLKVAGRMTLPVRIRGTDESAEPEQAAAEDDEPAEVPPDVTAPEPPPPADDTENTAAVATVETRPYPPEVLRARIRKKAESYRLGPGEPATEKQMGFAAGMLELCFAPAADSDRMRRTVYKYLAGIDAMNGPEALALLDWLHPTKDSGDAWAVADLSAKEARMALAAAIVEAGQMELPL